MLRLVRIRGTDPCPSVSVSPFCRRGRHLCKEIFGFRQNLTPLTKPRNMCYTWGGAMFYRTEVAAAFSRCLFLPGLTAPVFCSRPCHLRILYLRCTKKCGQDQSTLCAAFCLLMSLCDTVGAILARQLTIQVCPTQAWLVSLLQSRVPLSFPSACRAVFSQNLYLGFSASEGLFLSVSTWLNVITSFKHVFKVTF